MISFTLIFFNKRYPGLLSGEISVIYLFSQRSKSKCLNIFQRTLVRMPLISCKNLYMLEVFVKRVIV